MKEIITQIYSWIVAILFMVDLVLIILLCVTISLLLLTPLIIMIGVPVLIDLLWKRK